MKVIVRKRQRRKLVETEKGELGFRLRGNAVRAEKIDRWMKKNGIAEDTLYAPSPVACKQPPNLLSSLQFTNMFLATPAALSVWTNSERNSPAPSSLDLMELSSQMGYESSQNEHPRLYSPTLSEMSIIMARSSAFRGRSPTITYRTLGVLEDLTIAPTLSSQYLEPSELCDSRRKQTVISVQYRYKQEDVTRLKQNLLTLEVKFGLTHPETLQTLRELGTVLWEQGRYKSSEEVCRRLVAECQKESGESHSSTLYAFELLSIVFGCQGFYNEAEKLQRKVLGSRTRVLGAEHPATLTGMDNLASTFNLKGRWKEAEELEVQVMETSMMVLGAEDPNTLSSMGNLASTYRKQGRWKEAEELQVQVMETSMRVLGAEHPKTLDCMSNLASTYGSQGRWKEAEELHVQVMETRMKVLGAEHPDTLMSICNLAFTLRNQHRNQEAQELMRECAELRERVLGLEHPDTISSRGILIKWEMDDLVLQASESY